MIVLRCNQPVYCDVDDTLVMWNRTTPDDPDAVPITCPTSRYILAANEMSPMDEVKPEDVVEIGSWTEYLKPHKKHIEQLKLHKLRGHTVIVWSAGGWEWAEAVVLALGLQKYVDLVVEKPMWAYDDKKPNEFFNTIWMKDE